MRRQSWRWMILVAVVAIVAACSRAAGPSPETPAPSGTANQAATVTPTDPGAPVEGAYRLRATLTQPIPPLSRFNWLPIFAITGDLQVVTAGPMIAIYPGSLLPNLQARSLSQGGFDRIVQQARDLGLLTGSGDFTPPDLAPGAALGRVQIVVDSVLHELIGDPSRVIVCVTTPCVPAAGTPEAFGSFWQVLADLSWLEGDLGPETPYLATSFAILVGVEPAEEPGTGQQVVTWPLATPLEAYGEPVGNDAMPRCGTVTGADAVTLRPALAAANELTRWVDAGAAPETGIVIQVRPMLPGEDVCLDLFGPAE